MKPILARTVPRNLSVRGAALRQRRHFATPRPSGDFVRIIEVGPRDGLQNEKKSIPVETKAELIRRLATTGLQTIEAGSFVSPKWVPQMANSDQIMQGILDTPPEASTPITYQWLLPNIRGLETFTSLSPGPSATPSATHEISIFLAATESFSKRNTNCTIAESLTRFGPLMSQARDLSIPVRAYISVAMHCPFEGAVSPTAVANLATELLELGADEISVADTTGGATAASTQAVLKALKAAGVRMEDIALHFHDTFGQALMNTMVGLEHGVRTFDSAVGGLGGCPYSPGATGNVPTEDLVYTLHALGAETGVDLDRLAEIGEWITAEVGRSNESRAGKGTLARLKRERA